MAQEDAANEKSSTRLIIRNIGLLLSGDLVKPILDADTVLAVDGKITAVGKEKDVDTDGATVVIDAKGTTLAPGLIDSHVHPVAGDWTPRQNQLGWIDSYMHGGVTTIFRRRGTHSRPAQRCGWTESYGGICPARLYCFSSRRRQDPCRRPSDRTWHGGRGL